MTTETQRHQRQLVAHIYFSPFVHESRAMRAIEEALKAGIFEHALAVGYLEQGLARVERKSTQLEIHRLRVDFLPFLPRLARRALAWFLWTLATAMHLRMNRPALIQTHSLAALPAGVLGSWLSKAAHIYDAHELETERVGWGAVQTWAARLLERSMIRSVDCILVVSGSIGAWYQQTYDIRKPTLVRNLPSSLQVDVHSVGGPTLKKTLGIPEDQLLFVYLGALGYGRGIPQILAAFGRLPPTTHFCALGYGEFTDQVLFAASQHKNIHYHPPVGATEVVRFVLDADVSLCLIEDVCLSYRYCLPNKLFESRLSNLPVLTSDLPEMAAFIRDYGGGWKVDLTIDAIVEAVSRIDATMIAEAKNGAREVPSWADEAPVYLEAVRDALKNRAS